MKNKGKREPVFLRCNNGKNDQEARRILEKSKIPYQWAAPEPDDPTPGIQYGDGILYHSLIYWGISEIKEFAKKWKSNQLPIINPRVIFKGGDTMQTVVLQKITRIKIGMFLIKGCAEKVIENSEDISNIVKLIQGKGERCAFLVESPQLKNFIVELYAAGILVSVFEITGDYIKRDDDWYLLKKGSLAENLEKFMEGVPLVKNSAKFK